MSTLSVVVLDTTTTADGMEWGPAAEYAPAIETDAVEQFLRENGAWDNAGTDTYALVVPNDLWDHALNSAPCFEIEVPEVQAQALTAAIEAN
ncbi:hypothetical protein [Nocardia sp. NPDC050435]|uniref:hypothetical protein n=1 Tax=Nocardia sp. NPDC050435 TaxID=3155040 RepID=UPI0033DB3B4F